jgi:hypothetical protein
MAEIRKTMDELAKALQEEMAKDLDLGDTEGDIILAHDNTVATAQAMMRDLHFDQNNQEGTMEIDSSDGVCSPTEVSFLITLH